VNTSVCKLARRPVWNNSLKKHTFILHLKLCYLTHFLLFFLFGNILKCHLNWILLSKVVAKITVPILHYYLYYWNFFAS